MSGTLRIKCEMAVFRVKKSALRDLRVFTEKPERLDRSSYTVRAKVSVPNFALFVESLAKRPPRVTLENCDELESVCKEFGYSGLDEDIARARSGEMDLQSAVCSMWAMVRGLESEVSSWKDRVSKLESGARRTRRKITEAVEAEAKRRRTCISDLNKKALAVTSQKMNSDGDGTVSSYGIIAKLTEECGGNVVTEGVVAVYARSVYDVDEQPRNAFDLANEESCYRSNMGSPQWICVDFEKREATLTGYEIRSGYLKSWILESSRDGERWTCIDNVVDCRSLEGDIGKIQKASFKIAKCGASRFIRLRVAGESVFDQLWLHSIEFFGRVTQ